VCIINQKRHVEGRERLLTANGGGVLAAATESCDITRPQGNCVALRLPLHNCGTMVLTLTLKRKKNHHSKITQSEFSIYSTAKAMCKLKTKDPHQTPTLSLKTLLTTRQLGFQRPCIPSKIASPPVCLLEFTLLYIHVSCSPGSETSASTGPEIQCFLFFSRTPVAGQIDALSRK
jgi:hypothetical protein